MKFVGVADVVGHVFAFNVEVLLGGFETLVDVDDVIFPVKIRWCSALGVTATVAIRFPLNENRFWLFA